MGPGEIGTMRWHLKKGDIGFLTNKEQDLAPSDARLLSLRIQADVLY